MNQYKLKKNIWILFFWNLPLWHNKIKGPTDLTRHGIFVLLDSP